MLNLIDNRRLLHTYQLYSNQHKDLYYHFKPNRADYAHPVYCEWCKRIWIFKRSCEWCKKVIYFCGEHEHIGWCKSHLKK